MILLVNHPPVPLITKIRTPRVTLANTTVSPTRSCDHFSCFWLGKVVSERQKHHTKQGQVSKGSCGGWSAQVWPWAAWSKCGNGNGLHSLPCRDRVEAGFPTPAAQLAVRFVGSAFLLGLRLLLLLFLSLLFLLARLAVVILVLPRRSPFPGTRRIVVSNIVSSGVSCLVAPVVVF